MWKEFEKPEDFLRQLLRKGPGGGWYVCVENRLVALPNWAWAVCEFHVKDPRPVADYERE